MPRLRKQEQQTVTDHAHSTLDDTPLAFESPESSTIQGAHYDPSTEMLTVGFKADPPRVYSFGGISALLWRDFLHATSKGKFFAERIRPMYAGRRL